MKRYPKAMSVLVSEAARGLSTHQLAFSAMEVIRWLQERYPRVDFHHGTVRCQIIQHTVNAHPSHDDYPDHGRAWKEHPMFMRMDRGVYRCFDRRKDQLTYDKEVKRDQSESDKPARGSRVPRSPRNMSDPRDLIEKLSDQERDAIDRTLAFMTYNPSIGRVLEKRGVRKFQEFAVSRIVPPLSGCRNRCAFDEYVLEAIASLQKILKTHHGQTTSFGQAQKPVNVFLKVYCDWANRPSESVAKGLRPCLHVPLDSILMKWLRQNLRADFEARIAPIYRKHGVMPSKLDLMHMNRDMYLAWQEWFRDIHPKRPVLLDVIWAVQREGLPARHRH